MSISKKYVINNNTKVNISETTIELIQAKRTFYKVISLTSILSLIIFEVLYYFSLLTFEKIDFILITIALSVITFLSFTKELIRFDVSQNRVKKYITLLNTPVLQYKTFKLKNNVIYLKNDEQDNPYKLILEHDSYKILRFNSNKTAHTFRKLINKKSQLLNIMEVKN